MRCGQKKWQTGTAGEVGGKKDQLNGKSITVLPPGAPPKRGPTTGEIGSRRTTECLNDMGSISSMTKVGGEVVNQGGKRPNTAEWFLVSEKMEGGRKEVKTGA